MQNAFQARKDSLLKSDQVALAQQPVTIAVGEVKRRDAPAREPHVEGEAKVDIVRADDGSIQQITVRCPCGRETTLHCEYPGKGAEDE